MPRHGRSFDFLDEFALLKDRVRRLEMNNVRASGLIPRETHSDDYSFELSDIGMCIESIGGSDVTFTMRSSDVVNWPDGCVIEVCQMGSGQITIQASTGVNLRSDGSRHKSAGLYATIGLRHRANDEWILSGDLTG